MSSRWTCHRCGTERYSDVGGPDEHSERDCNMIGSLRAEMQRAKADRDSAIAACAKARDEERADALELFQQWYFGSVGLPAIEKQRALEMMDAIRARKV